MKDLVGLLFIYILALQNYHLSFISNQDLSSTSETLFKQVKFGSKISMKTNPSPPVPCYPKAVTAFLPHTGGFFL